MVEKKIEEVVTDLDNAVVKTVEPDMVDEPEVIEDRILTVKKGNKKDLSLAELLTMDVPADTLYYGAAHPGGLREVRRREMRAGHKFHDYVVWYERVISVKSELRKLAYHVVHEPAKFELFDEYFYPCTQWNISRGLLTQQDHTPDWKKMISLQEGGTPFMIGGQRLRAYHFVVMNSRYRPIEVARGRKIDGVFAVCPPASGTYIKSFRAAIITLGGTGHGFERQRVVTEQETANVVIQG